MTTKSPYRRPSLVQIERDGYKNSADILAARVAELESGDGDTRVKELTAELDMIRRVVDSQQRELTRQAEKWAHENPWRKELDYYKRRVRELEDQQKTILDILGHNWDGLDHTEY